MPFRTAVLIAIVLAAAGPGRRETHLGLQRRWEAVVADLPASPDSALPVLDRFRVRYGLPFECWADSTADPRFYPIDDEAPCGPVATVFCKRLPPADTSVEMEYAVEVDSTGREIRRWPIPLGGPVEGVSGDSLFVPLFAWDEEGASLVAYLAIRSDGAYGLASAAAEWKGAVETRCPPVAAFDPSDSLRCVVLKDRASGRLRRIAYQAPCS